MDSLKTEIENLINKKHKTSNGSNGYYVVDLKNLLSCNLLDLNKFLNEMYIEKIIKTQKGINGLLIMKK
jgi:hypothetical protein